MSISMQCQCGRVITVSNELAGQPTRCPSCGRRHLIPQAPQRPVAPVVPRVAPQPPAPADDGFGGHQCADCHSPLLQGAVFCHKCGLPAASRRHKRAVVKPRAQRPVAPVVQAPVEPAPRQMVDPFQAPVTDGGASPQTSPFRNPAAAAALGSFARAMRKANLPVSGLGRVAMTCTYMAIFIGMFAGVLALPMVGYVTNTASMPVGQAISLYKLLHGMGLLVLLFSFVGVLTGFLGVFHFGRRRSNAVGGLLLSALVAAGTLGGFWMLRGETQEIRERIRDIRNGVERVEPEVISECERARGCFYITTTPETPVEPEAGRMGPSQTDGDARQTEGRTDGGTSGVQSAERSQSAGTFGQPSDHTPGTDF